MTSTLLENTVLLEVHMARWGRWPVSRGQLRAEALGPRSDLKKKTKKPEFSHKHTPPHPSLQGAPSLWLIP